MKEFFLFGYFSLFVGFVLALYYWEQRQRKRRLPFPDDLRLLRGPGETQFALVREQEVMEIVWLILAGCAPVAVLAVLLWIALLVRTFRGETWRVPLASGMADRMLR